MREIQVVNVVIMGFVIGLLLSRRLKVPAMATVPPAIFVLVILLVTLTNPPS